MSDVIYAGSGLRYTETAVKTIGNTVTETACTGFTLAANTLKPGAVIRFVAPGQLTATSTPTITLKVNFGGTAVLSIALSSLSATATAFVWKGCMTIRSATALIGYAETISSESTLEGRTSDVSADTIDTTADNAVTLSATWGTANASNTVTFGEIVFWVENGLEGK